MAASPSTRQEKEITITEDLRKKSARTLERSRAALRRRLA